MCLETERLLLRRWRPEDLEAFYEAIHGEEITVSYGVPPIETMEDAEKLFKEDYLQPKAFAMVLKSTGVPVGSVLLEIGDECFEPAAPNEAEIGFFIAKPYWNRGLTTEAVREILRYAVEERGIVRFFCGYFTGNEASHRVMEKCGFRYAYTKENFFWELQQVYRTEIVTTLTREEWLSGCGQVSD